MVNHRAPVPEPGKADLAFVFQVSLELRVAGGLVPRPSRRDEASEDLDDRIADLQYRECVEWAVGYSVAAEPLRDAQGRVIGVRRTSASSGVWADGSLGPSVIIDRRVAVAGGTVVAMGVGYVTNHRARWALAWGVAALLGCTRDPFGAYHLPPQLRRDPAPGSSAGRVYLGGPFGITDDAGYAYGADVRWIEHGLRVERRDGRLVVAPIAEAHPFRAVLPKGRGWRLIGRGRIADVDDFLAPLPETDWRRDESYGRGTGRVVTFRDGQAIDFASPLPGHLVMDAAFSDVRRGVAIVEPGWAYRTEDNGQSWVQIHGSYSDTVAIEGRRWVLGRDHCLAVDDAGRVARASCDEVRLLLPRGGGPPDEPRVLAWAPRAHERAVEEVVLRDARHALLGTEEGVVVADLVGGIVQPIPQAPLPCAQGQRAQRIVSERPTLLCTDPRRPDGVYATLWRDQGRGWERSMRLADVLQCYAREDGDVVLCDGTCAGRSHGPDARGWCVVRGDVETSFETPAGFPFGGWLRGVPVFLDLRGWRWIHGAGAPQALLGPGSDGSGELVVDSTWHPIGRDGLLRIPLVVRPGRPRAVLEGPPGGRFRLRALPGNDARRLADDDPTELLACGDDGALLLRAPGAGRGALVSLGSGDPWHGALDGADDALRAWLGPAIDATETLRCDGAGMNLGFARTLGWGPLRGATLGPGRVPHGTLRRRRPDFTWRCDVAARSDSEPPEQTPRRLPGLPGFDQLSGMQRIAGQPTRGIVWTRLGAAGLGVTEHEILFSEELRFPHLDHFASVVGLSPTAASILTLRQEGQEIRVGLHDARDGAVTELRRTWRFESSFPDEAALHRHCSILWCPREMRPLRNGILEPLWVGTRSLVALSLPAWSRHRAWRVLLIDHEISGEVHDEVLEIQGPTAAGVFLLGGRGGVAFTDEAGTVWGMATDGVRQRLAARVTWDACPADASGAVALGVSLLEDGMPDRITHHPNARGEFALAGDVLCLRSVVDPLFRMEPTRDGWRAQRRDARYPVLAQEACRPTEVR